MVEREEERNAADSSSSVDQWLRTKGTPSPEIELSVIIPAFNEERRLPNSLIEIIDYLDTTGRRYELIVVDDGSTDKTAEIVKKFERIRPAIRLICLPRNGGKGAAVRMGVLNCHGKRVLFCDADGATPIPEIVRLDEAIDKGADVAFGSRALTSDETSIEARFHRKVMGRIFNFFVNAVVMSQVADTQCGFKMFTRESAQFLFSRQITKGFTFDVELLFLARRNAMKIVEVPVNWSNVPGSKVNLVSDSLLMLIELFVIRIRHRKVKRP
jgi:dolichyl-phosphate beta-glucosyltransferase